MISTRLSRHGMSILQCSDNSYNNNINNNYNYNNYNNYNYNNNTLISSAYLRNFCKRLFDWNVSSVISCVLFLSKWLNLMGVVWLLCLWRCSRVSCIMTATFKGPERNMEQRYSVYLETLTFTHPTSRNTTDALRWMLSFPCSLF